MEIFREIVELKSFPIKNNFFGYGVICGAIVRKYKKKNKSKVTLTITTSRQLPSTLKNKHSMSSYLRLAFHTWLYSSLFVGLLEAKKTTWLPALLGRPRARALTSHVLVVIAKLIFLTPQITK